MEHGSNFRLQLCSQSHMLCHDKTSKPDCPSQAFLTSYPQLREPPTWPHHFSLWRSLIFKSQHQSMDNAHTIYLPRAYVRLLHSATSSSIATGRIYDEEDLIVGFPPSSWAQPPSHDASLRANSLWFLRLDPCSTKDSVDHDLPITSTLDIIRRLVTSGRARKAFKAYLGSTGDGIPLTTNQPDMPIYLLPWNPRMNSSRELRCFVPPAADGTVGTCLVAAVSQYSSTVPYPLAPDPGFCPHERERHLHELFSRIIPCIQKLHQDILLSAMSNSTTFTQSHTEPNVSVLQSLLLNGFSFDVWQDDDLGNEIQLIELNSFGVRSRCGPCLFNWVEDFDILYGFEDGVHCKQQPVAGVSQDNVIVVRLLR